MNPNTITLKRLTVAHKHFRKLEPRDVFYRVATELIRLSLCKRTDVTVPDALAVLLQTWNKAFYRFHPFDERHFSEIENIVEAKQRVLLQFRRRSIHSFVAEDEPVIEELFREFELVLGPVGAAKSIHLLAPRFFPLWDRAIAKAYGVPLKQIGENAEGYIQFMKETKTQVEHLDKSSVVGGNLLKAIDEFNYCTYTLHKERTRRK